MDHGKRKVSNRRNFLKTTALAGMGWAPFLHSPTALADAAGSLMGQRSTRFLDPDGEVRVGLIGYGGHHDIVLKAIPGIPGARLAAFALGDGERVAEELSCGREEGVRQSALRRIQSSPAFHRTTRVYDTFQEMFAKEDLDVVAACLPYSLNAHASMAAARRGCHVIAEKPLATDLETLATLESVIRESKVQITAMLPLRLHSGVAAVRKAIADGLIGEPFLAFAQKSYKPATGRPALDGSREVTGATFPWIGIHALDTLSYATGVRIIQASALQNDPHRSAASGSQEIAGILLKLANNATGIVSLDCLPADASRDGNDRLRVAGTLGAVEMNGERVELTTPNGPPRQLPLVPRGSIFASFVTFLRGQGSHVMTSEEAFDVTRVSLTVRQAAAEGLVLKTA